MTPAVLAQQFTAAGWSDTAAAHLERTVQTPTPLAATPADIERALTATVVLLLDAALQAEQIFARQGWVADGSSLDPEAIALVALRAAIAQATSQGAP